MNAKKFAAQENKLDKPLPPLVIAIIPFYTAFIVGLFLFPVAGDWGWLQGWLFTISVALTWARVITSSTRSTRVCCATA
jgi:hypothetical protein